MNTVFAYVIVAVEVQKPNELRLPGDYDPGVRIGDIAMLESNVGAVKRWVNDDGPVKVHTTAVRVGDGQADGEDVTFELPVRRALALLQIGAEGERAIKEQAGAILDAVEEQLLELVSDGVEAVAKFRLAEIRKRYTR